MKAPIYSPLNLSALVVRFNNNNNNNNYYSSKRDCFLVEYNAG